MTSRATSRHRSAQRAATPLSTLTTVVGEHVGTISRGGVVIAMSSGLVATMGLPAQGAGRNAAKEAPAKAAPTAEALSFRSDVRVEPLTASSTAKVDFDGSQSEGSSFTVRRTPAPERDITTAGQASISGTSRSGTSRSDSAVAPVQSSSSVIAIASRYVGVPYRSGGESPSGFDCSGFTQYVFKQLGISLARTANDQMNSTTPITRSQAKAGDLVFILSGGRATHVGFYLGNNRILDSPHSGDSVRSRQLWTSNVTFRRVS